MLRNSTCCLLAPSKLPMQVVYGENQDVSHEFADLL